MQLHQGVGPRLGVLPGVLAQGLHQLEVCPLSSKRAPGRLDQSSHLSLNPMISSTSVDLLLVSEMSSLTMLSTRLWLGMLTMG